MFSIKNQRNNTETTNYNLFFLSCLYKYSDHLINLFNKWAILTILKIDSAAMFHKSTELISSQILFGYKVCGLIQIWPSYNVKVSTKFRFCFNERLNCSAVKLFQSNLNLILDLSSIVNEAIKRISSQFFFTEKF